MNLFCFFSQFVCSIHILILGSFCLVCSAILVSSKAWQQQRWPSLAVSNEGFTPWRPPSWHWERCPAPEGPGAVNGMEMSYAFFQLSSCQWFILRISISTYSVMIIYIYIYYQHIFYKSYIRQHIRMPQRVAQSKRLLPWHPSPRR